MSHRSVPCEICYTNIIVGIIYRIQRPGCPEVIICDECQRVIADAEDEYFDGRADEGGT